MRVRNTDGIMVWSNGCGQKVQPPADARQMPSTRAPLAGRPDFFGADGCLKIWQGVGVFATSSSSSSADARQTGKRLRSWRIKAPSVEKFGWLAVALVVIKPACSSVSLVQARSQFALSFGRYALSQKWHENIDQIIDASQLRVI